MDCYVIVDRAEILRRFGAYFDNIFISDACAYQYDTLTKRMQRFLTEDRVFGILTTNHLEDFFIPQKVLAMRREIEQNDVCITAVLTTGTFRLGSIRQRVTLYRSLPDQNGRKTAEGTGRPGSLVHRQNQRYAALLGRCTRDALL